jgi:hypothetical protein
MAAVHELKGAALFLKLLDVALAIGQEPVAVPNDRDNEEDKGSQGENEKG